MDALFQTGEQMIETLKIQKRAVWMVATSLTVAHMQNTISWIELACRARPAAQPELTRLIKLARVQIEVMKCLTFK